MGHKETKTLGLGSQVSKERGRGLGLNPPCPKANTTRQLEKGEHGQDGGICGRQNDGPPKSPRPHPGTCECVTSGGKKRLC